MKHQARKILVFGAQGSGKGTQAELISRNCRFNYISTGDIFRREIKKKTKLGSLALKYINDGKLVPDSVTNDMVKKYLNKPDTKKRGFVLDGYPRTLAQKQALEKMEKITDVIVIEISDQEAVKRLGGRLACICGLSYHVKFNPPKKKGICDRCGRKLFVRDDDKPKAIRERLKNYHRQTKILYDDYKKQNLLHVINGQQPIEKVFADIAKNLELNFCTNLKK